jgi:hypothetical protein
MGRDPAFELSTLHLHFAHSFAFLTDASLKTKVNKFESRPEDIKSVGIASPQPDRAAR